MSRLIDANANREKFKEIVYRTLNDCNITTKKKFNIIMTAFDNMPTAYDISKVVAELEDAKFLMPPENDNHYADNGLFLEDAINIVRKGGVE